VRRATILVAALLLAGCGAKKHEPNVTFTAIPVFPGATDARDSANATFATRDWTLPKGTLPSQVYAWYVQRLTQAGWKITDKNETGLRAHRGARSLSLGVRGRTLEAISS
jgi:hypothetical protein